MRYFVQNSFLVIPSLSLSLSEYRAFASLHGEIYIDCYGPRILDKICVLYICICDIVLLHLITSKFTRMHRLCLAVVDYRSSNEVSKVP